MNSLRLFRHRLCLQIWLWLSTSATLFVSLASSSTHFPVQSAGGNHGANAFVISKFYEPNEAFRHKHMFKELPRRSGNCICPVQSPDIVPVYNHVRKNAVIMCASDNKQRKSRVLTRRSSRANTAPEETTQHQVLDEFSAKAASILAEAGGRMLSSNFKRRWKFTFPDDSMDRLQLVMPVASCQPF